MIKGTENCLKSSIVYKSEINTLNYSLCLWCIFKSQAHLADICLFYYQSSKFDYDFVKSAKQNRKTTVTDL